MQDVDWSRIPGPAYYSPAEALAAAHALTGPVSPAQAARAVADLAAAVSNDHQGTLYPAAVPAVRIFLAVIAAMPGSPRGEALSVLLDWYGTFQPGPGFETYDDPAARPVHVTDAITRLLRDAEPMLRQVADDDHKRHRKLVMHLLCCLDADWTHQALPQKRSRRKSRIDDPAWPGTAVRAGGRAGRL